MSALADPTMTIGFGEEEMETEVVAGLMEKEMWEGIRVRRLVWRVGKAVEGNRGFSIAAFIFSDAMRYGQTVEGRNEEDWIERRGRPLGIGPKLV